METWVEDGQLYTYRKNIRNWEHNTRNISEDKFEALKDDRQKFIDVGSLLVIPKVDESGEEYFLAIGGNMRNLADEAIGKEVEPIQIIRFIESDGRWWVEKNGAPLLQYRSFLTEFEAMMTYSALHNNGYGKHDKDKIANLLGHTELEGMDWSKMFVTFEDEISVAELADKVAPGALDDINKASEEAIVDHPMFNEESNGVSQFEERLVRCPECSSVFDPRKHPAENEEPVTDLINEPTPSDPIS